MRIRIRRTRLGTPVIGEKTSKGDYLRSRRVSRDCTTHQNGELRGQADGNNEVRGCARDGAHSEGAKVICGTGIEKPYAVTVKEIPKIVFGLSSNKMAEAHEKPSCTLGLYETVVVQLHSHSHVRR